jgi:endonuclease/exonuclease/phosphatase family metal-dependent hydrolase
LTVPGKELLQIICFQFPTNHKMQSPDLIIDNSFSKLKLKKQKIFKILTYNVFAYQQNHKTWLSNIPLLIEFLSKLDLDFIGLQVCLLIIKNQEVYQYEDSHLPFIAKSLKMNFVFGVAFEDNFGNAILSKYQIQEAESHKIQIDNNEIRSLIIMKTPYFNLNVTHLDVNSEDVRLKQYGKILKLMDHKNPNIFMGDFNSLRFEDYSTEKWKKIEKVRKEKNWELPQIDLIKEVEKDFYDVWTHSTNQGFLLLVDSTLELITFSFQKKIISTFKNLKELRMMKSLTIIHSS